MAENDARDCDWPQLATFNSSVMNVILEIQRPKKRKKIIVIYLVVRTHTKSVFNNFRKS